LPNDTYETHPLFLGMNFYGNQSIMDDPEIPISTQWMKSNESFGIVNHRATEATRGVRHYRWPVEKILERGYGLVTFYYGDVDADFDDGFQNGVQPLYYKPDQTKLLLTNGLQLLPGVGV
jgi:(4-O-methyl)-D-glucuronate---lignin esterase